MKRRINITIAENLYNDLIANSIKYHRSLSQEIEYRLEMATTQTETETETETDNNRNELPSAASVAVSKEQLQSQLQPQPKRLQELPPTPPTDEEILKYIEEYERYKNNPQDEYYLKIKKYFTTTDRDLWALKRLLELADQNNVNAVINNYSYAIHKALDIPINHDLSRKHWKELVDCLR